MSEKFKALNKTRENGDGIRFWRNKNPMCPHCGEFYDIQENQAWELCDPSIEDHEIECPECGIEFKVKVTVSFSYSTDEADEADDEND